jgi:hypothetical protein
MPIGGPLIQAFGLKKSKTKANARNYLLELLELFGLLINLQNDACQEDKWRGWQEGVSIWRKEEGCMIHHYDGQDMR